MREDGVPNLRETLEIAREEALQEYRNHSEDAEYLIYLNDFLDNKQKRLLEENNKIYELQNINYLQMHSEQLIEKVNRDKLSQAAAQKEIDQLA